MYRAWGKRLLDLCLVRPALLALSPVMTLVAVLVRFRMGPPVLFRQRRPGQHGRLFTLLKFRTMTDDRDASGHLLPDAQRLHPLGRLLRGTSLDELPELLNVLKGDMSLVGPRPLFAHYLDRYTPAQMRRHEMRPGITGLAQVSGRNALTWEQKFARDLEYVERVSLALDLRIIGRTVRKILVREGISQEGHATAEEFMGSLES